MISVIIPYKEDRGYLQEALDSLDKQTFKDFEVIQEQSDNLVGVNVNRGIKKAKGKYICYLCDDDMLTPDSLKDRFEFMESNNFDFIHSKGLQLFSDGVTKPYNLTNEYAQFNSVLLDNGIMGGSTMYRGDMLKENLFNEDLWTCEEWELHLRLLNNNYKLGFLNKITYIYRRHGQQKSIGNISIDYQAKRDKVKETIRRWYTQPQ